MQFAILGPLQVRDEAGVLTPAPGKRRALLALLLLARGAPVTVDRLAEDLWDGRPPPKARNAVQAHVSKLRKELGDAGRLIAAGPGGYALDVDEESFDVARFERLVAAALRDDADAAAQHLREALELWRGPALCDVPERFAQREAVRLEDARLQALEARIDADLELGRHDVLVAELEGLVEEHPYRERLRGQLMLALYRSGRQADALAVHADGRRVLAAELGLEPGPALRELERRILGHAPELGLPSRGTGRSSLPTPPTPLVGRERELGELEEILARDDVRLLTLTGTGGIGKTRLALEATRRAAAGYADGAVLVPLAAIGDEALVGPAIAKALGLREDESLAVALAPRSQLLFLDSFERLLGAAPLIGELLAAAPRLNAVVTSRAALRLTGEQEYPVQPLGEEPAATLFVQRASAVSPGFALTDENSAPIAGICARLEGLPLAIELAAARTKLLTPAVLLTRLTSRLDVLTAGARDAPERHQTMRAAIDWSYRLLDAPDRRLLDELAVFVGGASLDAIEATCGDVLETLASLVDNSLVHRGEEAEPRFRLLDVIREYALEQLALQDEAEVRTRHAAYFLALAESAEDELEHSHQQEWLDRLELEHPNLRAALDFALASGDDESALRGAIGLRRFWLLHGHLAEGRARLETVLARGVGSAEQRSAALNGLGFLAGEQGDLDASERYFEESLELARGLSVLRRIAGPLGNLGNIAIFRGDVGRAIELYTEALALNREAHDEFRTAVMLQNLGSAYVLVGERRRAIELLEEGLATARRLGHTRQVASTLLVLGRTLAQDGERERPRAAAEEALAIDRALGDRQGIADCLELLGAVDGNAERTAVLYGAAAGLRESIGARRHPEHVDWYRAVEDASREALGEHAFEAAAARGRELSPDEAAALATDGAND